MTIQSIASIFRQVLAIAAVALAAIPQDSIPVAARPALAIVGGIILAVEHYVGDPSTGKAPPAPPAG